jgi:hypothetical protein
MTAGALQTFASMAVLGSWRRFGRAEDLELDFDTNDRPTLVTDLLTSCSELHNDQYWWSQTVGTRIAALLRLMAATDAVNHLNLLTRCQDPACGERFEFELPLSLVVNYVPEKNIVQVVLDGTRAVSLRHPNGQDLREWRRQSPTSRKAAITAMLQSLVIEGQVTHEDEPIIAEALSIIDPLVAFAVSCVCPICAFPNEVTVDLEDIALTHFKRRQLVLLHEIHELASRYGWTEAEILAIQPGRRARYLTMIEE